MPYKLTPKKIILILVISVIVIEGGYLLFNKPSTSEAGKDAILNNAVEKNGNGEKIEGDKLRENLEKRIKDVGIQQTYEDYKEAFKDFSFGVSHSAAHVMGDLLFASEGIEGLTICDNTFAFGCYHAFFGRALTELGLSSVKELDAVCIEQYGPLGTGCQHGIGHGILEYFGNNNLPEALKACKKTTQLKELFGCTSGVFMEYNFPTDIGPDETTTDMRDMGENPYAPCNTIVPDEFKRSCYYEQNQWWSRTYDKSLQKNIELCTNIPEKEYQEACFLGLGEISAPSTFYDPEKAIEICENIPNKEQEILCKAGSSWGFFANPDKRDIAPQICTTLPEEDRDMCIEASDLVENEEIKKIYEKRN